MKQLDQMTGLEKRSLGRFIRRSLEGRVLPEVLHARTHQELPVQCFQNIEDKKSTVVVPE